MTNLEKNAFLIQFLPTMVGRTVPFSQLNEEILKLSHNSISNAAWERAIGEVRDRLPWLKLKVVKRNAVIVQQDTPGYIVELRRKERPKTKCNLGRALWQLLLGNLEVASRIKGDTANELRKRLQVMRASGTLTIYLDAGSTAESFSHMLDELPALSLPSTANRLQTRLRIVTTSISIADFLCKCRHQDSIEIYAVGGQLWPSHMSMAGFVTQKLLPIYSELFNNCVGIVGASGYRPVDGRAGANLLCNSMEERMVKDWIVRHADLSIAIFGCDKLQLNYVPRIFAPLAAINLVVTDDGTEEPTDESLPQTVAQFCLTAHAHGTATLIVE